MSGEPGRENTDLATDEASAKDADAAQRNADEAEIEIDTDISDDDPLAAMQTQANENWEKYVRSAAELENVRKRAARDVENAHRFSLERFARELLGVRDSLEMGIDVGTEVDADTLLKGSQATLKLLVTTMQQFGVEELDPHGEPFDPELHEAMTMQPSADVEPGSVLTVFQKGYTLNGRLLRPARVVVAQEIPKNSPID
jgi:molecular chaperone GrpE